MSEDLCTEGGRLSSKFEFGEEEEEEEGPLVPVRCVGVVAAYGQRYQTAIS